MPCSNHKYRNKHTGKIVKAIQWEGSFSLPHGFRRSMIERVSDDLYYILAGFNSPFWGDAKSLLLRIGDWIIKPSDLIHTSAKDYGLCPEHEFERRYEKL